MGWREEREGWNEDGEAAGRRTDTAVVSTASVEREASRSTALLL